MADSRQRRIKRRLLERAGLSLPRKPPKQVIEAQKPLSFWSRTRKRVFGLLSAAVTVAGLLVFYPVLSIERAGSLDSSNPYASLFDISNEGYLPITSVSAECRIDFELPGGGYVRNVQIAFPNFVKRLKYKERATPPCFRSIGPSFPKNASDINLRITLGYTILVLPHRNQEFCFLAAPTKNGDYVWIHQECS